jgi:hypothetical protein
MEKHFSDSNKIVCASEKTFLLIQTMVFVDVKIFLVMEKIFSMTEKIFFVS